MRSYIDGFVVRLDDDIHEHLLLQTYMNRTIIALNPTSMFQSLQPSSIYRTVENMANTDHPSFTIELSNASEFSSVDKANQFS